MSTYKLNLARVRGLPAADELAEIMTVFGLPEGTGYGVLSADAAGDTLHARIVAFDAKSVETLDRETGEVGNTIIETVAPIAFAAYRQAERLEVYSGSMPAIFHVAEFFGSELALAVVVDPVELDLLSAVDRLLREQPKCQLRSATTSDYAASSYMIGGYGPKFMDTDHGRIFLEEYLAGLKSVQLRFAGPNGRVTVTLRPNGCLNYTCNDDDQSHVRSILRKLI